MIVSTDLYVILVISQVYTKEKLPSVLSQIKVAKTAVFHSTKKVRRVPLATLDIKLKRKINSTAAQNQRDRC